LSIFTIAVKYLIDFDITKTVTDKSVGKTHNFYECKVNKMIWI
jgi:hypothetical protein